MRGQGRGSGRWSGSRSGGGAGNGRRGVAAAWARVVSVFARSVASDSHTNRECPVLTNDAMTAVWPSSARAPPITWRSSNVAIARRRDEMPGGDGTGPTGVGPLTGWGRGVCGRPGGAGRVSNGEVRRGGRGRRNRFWATGRAGWNRWAPPAPYRAEAESALDSERRWLKERSAALEAEHRNIRARLEELGGKRND